MNIAKCGGVSSIHLQGKFLEETLHIPLVISYPYQTNQSESKEANITPSPEFLLEDDNPLSVTTHWNGRNLSLGSIEDRSRNQATAVHFLTWANEPTELAKEVYFVPLRRGDFTSPVYSVTTERPTPSTDLEVASMLAGDRFFGYKVSEYMEMVADRQLHARPQIGTASFTIDSVPRNRETPVSIVNEGFGVNQLAYMLTIALYEKARIILIEEPEIHLHPSMVRKLVHALADIALNNDKRFVISTHSEVFVVALLSQIAKGEIGVDDVSFLLAEKEDGESRFTKQEAKSNGQIQGGLESFIASEFEDIAAFLGLEAETN